MGVEALEGHLGMLRNGQGHSHQSFNIFDIVTLVRHGKTDRMPRVARPTGTTDPMHIILRLIRQIVIDHQFNPRDIDASGRDIRGDEDAVFPAPEAFQRVPPLSLGTVGVDFGDRVLEAPDIPGNLFRTMFGP